MSQHSLPSSSPSPLAASIGPMLQKIREDFQCDRPLLPEPLPTGSGAASTLLAQMSDEEEAALYALAETILQNPEQVRQLGDRVYELLQTDIRYQRDRNGYIRR